MNVEIIYTNGPVGVADRPFCVKKTDNLFFAADGRPV
jgi:hypothetical protein